MTPLSLVMPFYQNQGMLWRHYCAWAREWPADLRARVEVVIVDDGSPSERAEDVERPAGLPELAIYRVIEDRPWHQHGARNLGAHVARHPWLLMTDMDHVCPADTLREVLAANDKGRAFTFGRVDAPAGEWDSNAWRSFPTTLHARTGRPKPHVNSFAISRALYWKVGGYDEDYCGHYGSDKLFRSRLWRKVREKRLDSPLIRVSRDVIPDASTRGVSRKEGRDPATKKRIADEKRARGDADFIRVLDFAWEQVHGSDFHSRPISAD
jgi:hypothetical protein